MNWKRRIPLAAALALLVAAPAAHREVFAAAPAAGNTLSASRYMQDVAYLASDALKGRGAAGPELDMAADYIAREFQRAGLRPAGDNGGYFQNFEIGTGAIFGPKNELEIAGQVLKPSEDFVAIAFSDTAEFAGSLIFAGYGVTAPEYRYDDYAGIDASGKIAVVFTHEPQENDPNSVFAGRDFTPHASFVNKAINARQHGAKGIVYITDPANHDYEDVGPATRREQSGDVGIPAIHAKRAAILKAFGDAGKDLTALQRAIDKDLTPQSFDTPAPRARIAAEVIRTRKIVRNVVAALPGSDPVLKNEWVVVGAHYDHLGLGGASSLAPSQIGEVHHGADDNASGTAGVLELARVAAKDGVDRKRSLLFAAFAAEEIGLLGSSYFVNHPPQPLASIDAMFNLDMIGRLTNNRLYIGGVGTSPGFKPMLDELNASAGFNLTMSESGYGASDQTSFNAKKIPVLFFFSGLHTDYHKPSDTADKINAPGAVKVLSLVHGAMGRLALQPQRLSYTEVLTPQQPGRGGGGGYGPYLGSVPDFRDDIKGVLFSDVVNNSPAAKAGLKPGDIMVEFDGKSVQNLADYAYALRQRKPGDVVIVVVKRNDREMRVEVTLEARR